MHRRTETRDHLPASIRPSPATQPCPWQRRLHAIGWTDGLDGRRIPPAQWLSRIRKDDTGSNRREHIVGAGLNPLGATRRSAQTMTTPVVNNVLATTVLLWQFAATAEILARGRTGPFAFFVAGFTALVGDLLDGARLLSGGFCLSPKLSPPDPSRGRATYCLQYEKITWKIAAVECNHCGSKIRQPRGMGAPLPSFYRAFRSRTPADRVDGQNVQAIGHDRSAMTATPLRGAAQFHAGSDQPYSPRSARSWLYLAFARVQHARNEVDRPRRHVCSIFALRSTP